MNYQLTLVTALSLLTTTALFGTVYYVDASRPDDSGNGLSWATAKKTIQAAVDAASAGDTVLVTNGVYATGQRLLLGTACWNRVVITKDITVRSVNGPGVTIIQGQGPLGTGAVRCVYMLGGVLSGFTLTNGFTAMGGNYQYDQSGGGVNMYGGVGVVSNCIITGNTAYLWGGGTYAGTVNNSVISGNSAANGSGGGTFDSSVNRCTISGNRASYAGGGAYKGTLNNSTISGNYASEYGGGVSDAIVNNSTISGNRASSYGGGAYGSKVNNSTISGNVTLQRYGAVYSCVVSNSIIYYNGNENYSYGSFHYCCTAPLPPGVGNISSEPLLLDTAHIHAQSPCVGAGNAASTGGTDIDGETWKNPPSIGCDEVYAGALTGRLSVTIVAASTAAVTGVGLGFTGVVRGLPASNVWQFGDGSSVANRAYVEHAWALPGSYMVVLTVFNADHPGGVAATVGVSIATLESMTFYVNAGNATPSYPYQSWGTAATTIQEAVDAAEAIGVTGARVLVTNGVYASGMRVTPGYASSNRVVITKHIIVTSVNGPGETIIQGQGPLGGGAVRCVYMVGGVLRGFTLTGGFTATNGASSDLSGGGVNMYGGNGLVSNCLITGNGAFEYGGGVSHGTVSQCTLSNNSAFYGAGMALGVVNDCTISGNSAGRGGGTYDSTVNNCTLSGNYASQYGGGTWGGIVNNSIISGNNAGLYGGGTYEGTVNNSMISGNSASHGGGVRGSAVNNCTINGNYAEYRGGGVAFGTVNNCTVSNNNADYGGGTYEGTVNNSTISGNSAEYGGGTSYGTIRNCRISGNTAQYGGGTHKGTVNNCAISRNSAWYGGGTYDSTVNNCTIVSNKAIYTGGGASVCRVQNSIVWGNAAAASNNNDRSTVTYSCLPEWMAGVGNITNDPQFIDAAGGNYRLSEASPCINAG
ncbi:MAG: PKD domain-containing protein, partial [bacterium]|nr:PKD domain-containing protein [bacterium]